MTVPLSNAVFSNDFTASLWFKAIDYTNAWPTLLYEQNGSLGMGIVGLTSGTADPSLIGDIDASASYAPATFGWYVTRTQTIPLSTYSHVVVTKSGTNIAMYWNGQVAVTGEVVNLTTLTGQYLQIGRAPDNEDVPGNSAFHGVIDDIRIYDRALASNEVQQLYAFESQPTVALKLAVKPSFANLYLGTNYQLQISSNLNSWTNFGIPFTPTNTDMDFTNYFDTDLWGQLYFRLQTVP
jgi:hypothetical protein